MTITSHLFESYLKCPTKCFLQARGEMGTGNAYADWVRGQNTLYRREGIQCLTQGTPENECTRSTRAAGNMKSVKWRLAIDLTARACNLESTIHAVERVASQGRGEPTQFIPIRFIYTEKLTKDDRLLLAFDTLVLSETLGREVGLGKIVHGDKSVTLEVKTGALAGQARKLTEKIDAGACLFHRPEPLLARETYGR